MRASLKALGALLLLSFSTSVCAGFTEPLTIRGLDVGDGGVLYIAFSSPIAVCGVSRVYILKSAPYYQDMLAMALSAYATGQPVQVWIHDCNASSGSLPAVRMIVDSVW